MLLFLFIFIVVHYDMERLKKNLMRYLIDKKANFGSLLDYKYMMSVKHTSYIFVVLKL